MTKIEKLSALMDSILATGLEPSSSTELGRYLRDRRSGRVSLSADELLLANARGFFNLFENRGQVASSMDMLSIVKNYIESGDGLSEISKKDRRAYKWLLNKRSGLNSPNSKTNVYDGELQVLIKLGLVEDGGIVIIEKQGV